MIWPEIPPGVPPAAYYVCVGVSVFLISLTKAGFGGGIGIVAIPLMGAVMPPQHMLGVMLPVLIAADVLSNLHYLKEYEWRLLRPLLVGALAGVLAGSAAFWAFRKANPVVFQKGLAVGIGTICLLFVAVQSWSLTGRRVPTLPTNAASSLAVGGAAGFVSTLSHAAGPIVTIYLLQEKIEKRVMVGTQLLYFLLINVSKVPTFVALGTINAATLRDSVWFLPLLPMGTLLGAWLNRRMTPRVFVAVMYALAGVSAGYMIWTALRRT